MPASAPRRPPRSGTGRSCERGHALSRRRAQGPLSAPSSLSLEQAWQAWLEAVKRGEILSRNRRPYKPATIRTYEHDVAAYVLDDLGARRLADIRADDLQALVDRLVGAGLSGSKVRNVLVPLQALYRRHRREVPLDPTDGLELPAPGGRRDRAVSPPVAEALLEALPEAERALWATRSTPASVVASSARCASQTWARSRSPSNAVGTTSRARSRRSRPPACGGCR